MNAMRPHSTGSVGISLLTIFGSVFAIFGALGTIPFPQPTALSATAEVGDTSSTPAPGTANSQASDKECNPVITQCGCGQVMKNGTCTQVGMKQNMYQCPCTAQVQIGATQGTVQGKCVQSNKCQKTSLPSGQPPQAAAQQGQEVGNPIPPGNLNLAPIDGAPSPEGQGLGPNVSPDSADTESENGSLTPGQIANPMGNTVPSNLGISPIDGAPSPEGQGLSPDVSAGGGGQVAGNGDDVFGNPTPLNANGSIPADTAAQFTGQPPSSDNPFSGSIGSINGENPVGPTTPSQLGPGSAQPFDAEGNPNPDYYYGTNGGDFSSTNPPGEPPPGGTPPPGTGATPPGGTPPPGAGAAPPGGSAGQGGGGGGSPPSMPQIPQSPPQQPQQPQQAQSCSGISQLLSLCPQPSCTMTASPSTVQLVSNGAQQPVTLSWQSQNAISGYLSALGSVPTSGTYTVYPQSSTGYSLQVTGQYGQASCNANVTVSQQCATPPAQPTSGCQGTWQPQTTPLSSGTSCTTGWQCSTSAGGEPAASLSCSPAAAAVGDAVAFSYACGNSTGSSGSGFSTNNQLTGTSSATIQTPPAGANTATYTLTCNNSTLSTSTAAECSVQIVTPQITFLANPPSVPSGETTSIGWVTTGMRSCLVSSPTDINFTAANANDLSPQGVAQTDPITTNTEFDLTCTTAGGSTVSASTVVTAQ